jgi:methylated-DNA-[protein]-cysteine S-methyltransferase
MINRSAPAAASGSKNVASLLTPSHSPAMGEGRIVPMQSQRDRVRQVSLPGFQAKLDTPFALVGVRTEGAVLAEIVYLPRSAGVLAPTNALAERACAQIEKYIADPEFHFKLPTKQVGTAFQRCVWKLIASIPCGETRRYGDLARLLKSGPRAVGQACGTNYFPLVIPCHRVVAANGLGGFAHTSSGYLLEVKRWLLAHEEHGT